jgi:hypothetical protein
LHRASEPVGHGRIRRLAGMLRHASARPALRA